MTIHVSDLKSYRLSSLFYLWLVSRRPVKAKIDQSKLHVQTIDELWKELEDRLYSLPEPEAWFEKPLYWYERRKLLKELRACFELMSMNVQFAGVILSGQGGGERFENG